MKPRDEPAVAKVYRPGTGVRVPGFRTVGSCTGTVRRSRFAPAGGSVAFRKATGRRGSAAAALGRAAYARRTSVPRLRTVSGDVGASDDGAQANIGGVRVPPDDVNDVTAEHAALGLAGGMAGAVGGEVTQGGEPDLDAVRP
ncbi:hypothetical protein GCM10010398_16210 [Streptomyces fimbriatus]